MDDKDEPRYTVRSPFLMGNSELELANIDTGDVLMIEKQMFKLARTFHIYRAGKLLATVRRSSEIFKHKLDIQLYSGPFFTVEGNFRKTEYRFKGVDDEIAIVSKKKGWSWKDTYGVAIKEGIDHAIILAVVVIIDILRDEHRSG